MTNNLKEREEIALKIWNSREQITQKVKEKEEKIQTYAKSIDWDSFFSLNTHYEEDKEYIALINNAMLDCYHPSRNYPNIKDIEKYNLVSYIQFWELKLISDMYIEKYNEKTGELKTKCNDCRTWTQIFCFFGWDYRKADIKIFQNGNWIFKLTQDQTEQLNKFLNTPYGCTNEALSILKNDEKIRELVLIHTKKKNVNMYWAARPIFDENKNISSQQCNHYMLEKAIKALF